MSYSDRYSEAHQAIQEHFSWVANDCIPGMRDPASEEQCRFLPEQPLFQRFHTSSGGKRILRGLLSAVFGDVPTAMLDDIVPKYLKIFCILLDIGYAHFVGLFVPHIALRDDRLPFDLNSPPHVFPRSMRDPAFLEKFCDAQWKFCSPKLERGNRTYWEDGLILPIVFWKKLGSGGSADIYKIEVHPEYNFLHRPGPDGITTPSKLTNTFVLKSYRGQDAENAYNAEGGTGAFGRLGKKGIGILGYFGSYRQRERFHVLLEYADQGTLEEYFKRTSPPTSNQDIICFYNAIFKVIGGLVRIHNVDEEDLLDGAQTQGWHQDVKPANILVTSLGKEIPSPYNYEIMLADLGLGHFKKGSLDRDTRGTRTYGAPECYRFDHLTHKVTFNVGSKVDIFSMGAILSEAVVWVVYSYKGLTEYRAERATETNLIPGFQDGNCFHNGEELLNTVRQWHRKVTAERRRKDVITSKVLGLIESMMEEVPAARLTAIQAWKQSQRIIENAHLKLVETTTPSRTDTGSYSQKLPTPSIVSSESHYSDPEKDDYFAKMAPHEKHVSFFGNGRVLSPDKLSEMSNGDGSDLHYRSPKGQPSSKADTRMSQLQPRDRFSSAEPTGREGHPIGLHDIGEHFGSGRESGNGYESRHSTPVPARPNHIVSSTHQHSISVPTTPLVGNHTGVHKFQPMKTATPNRMPTTNLPLRPYEEASNTYSVLPESRPLSYTQTSSGPSTPSPTQVKRLPFAVAINWRDDKKNKNPKPCQLPHAWLLASKLKQRDHLFIVDDSESMSRNWNQVVPLFSILAYILKEADPNGLDLLFTMSDEVYNQKHTSKLVKTIRERTPEGRSDIRLRLNAILNTYLAKLSNQKGFREGGSRFGSWAKEVLPLSIYVFTDGAWLPGTDAKPAIRNLVSQLHELGMPENQVGIQFISFGHDPIGIRRLEELDDLQKTENLRFDVVDTTPSTGDNLWKMLLGPIDKEFDEGV